MNLYLAGYRGSGKSTLARLVGERLALPVCDLDRAIETAEGQPVAGIFARVGEAGFRQLESQALAEWSARGPLVIALGGGACLSPDNRQRIRQTGRCVWLTADAEVLDQRIRQDPGSVLQRPRLTGLPLREEIGQLLEQRREGYAACADWTLDTGSLPPDELAARICEWWLAGR